MAKSLIEDLIGEEVNAFRAPGFSITKNNTWALRCLGELGFEYDCSMFPAPMIMVECLVMEWVFRNG